MRKLVSRLVLAAALALSALTGSQAALAQTAPSSANVTVNDTGFNPVSVSIAQGGSVKWTNAGSDTHNAGSQGQAPLPFDTGGISPGQSASVGFSVPGTYHYTAATDCRNGVQKPNFNCGADYTVIVGGTAAPATPAAAPTPASAAPAPAPAGPAPAATTTAAESNASVSITNSGFTPPTVNIGLGGSVTWTNTGNVVHTATTSGIRPVGFDTGGLSPGQASTITFNTPGTYQYTSFPDCLSGSHAPGFDCTYDTIVVAPSAAPAGATAPAPAPAPSAAPAPAPAASITPSTPAANTNITIDDTNGFTPNVLNIAVGQSVTWTNSGNNVHTATSDSGYIPSFDSGGLGKGQSYSFTFTKAGTFTYHSATDPVYYTNPNQCNCTLVKWQFAGTINVS